MVKGRDLVALALTQEGDRYVFGREVSASDSNPSAFDCSELVEWVCARLKVSPRMPDGSWNQVSHCRRHGTLLAVEDAIGVPGALLFAFRGGDPFSGKRPDSAHVAISQGNGRTIEARSSRHGTGVFPATGRGWTHAGLIPGVDYSEEDDVALSSEEQKALDWLVTALKSKREDAPPWGSNFWGPYQNIWGYPPAPLDPVTHVQLGFVWRVLDNAIRKLAVMVGKPGTTLTEGQINSVIAEIIEDLEEGLGD